MINKDRVVPVQNIDLISLYGLVLLQDSNNLSLEKLAAEAIGEFAVKTNSKIYLAAEPVKSLDFDATASSVSAGTVYFVADYDFVGVTKDGAKVTATVSADAVTLYKAVLSSGTVTVSKVGF